MITVSYRWPTHQHDKLSYLANNQYPSSWTLDENRAFRFESLEEAQIHCKKLFFNWQRFNYQETEAPNERA